MVYSEHTTLDEEGGPLSDELARGLCHASAATCWSERARVQLTALVASSELSVWVHPHILPAHLDEHDMSPSPEPYVTVMTAARIDDKKGVDTLIEAFMKASEGRPWLRLLVAGDGPELGRCRALAAALGVSERVAFRGWLPYEEVLRELSASDVFALLSRSEGLPLTVMEAMFCCKPVVATPVGGIPELIEHGESGFLVPVGDSEAAAEHLGLLADSALLRASIGAAGSARVREAHATPEEAAAWWVDVYSTAARSAGSGGPSHNVAVAGGPAGLKSNVRP